MKIRRLLLAAALAAILNPAAPGDDRAAQFDSKLDNDQRILQAINRLTFGARPGDVEEVRKMGLEKWIDLQLHPDRILENPALETKLKPLESIRLDSGEILKQYYPQFPPGFMRPTPIFQLLQGEAYRKIYNGTADERRAAIMALDPEMRTKVLAVIPTNLVECIPELQTEQAEARKKQQEERQMEMRRLRPQLNDLLEPQQARIARNGTPAERAALFASLGPEKLQQVAKALPPNSQALADYPELRRMANMSRSPQQVVIEDLREAKLYRAIYSNRQLEEVLTDFWFNHFNVFEGKGQDRVMLASYERDAIRPNVLGKFKDLLLATARHPAMLQYLDNWESMAAESMDVGPFAPPRFAPQGGFGRQAHGLNENYGRELLELHTLGVDGGYTQQDVIAVARCFTGWTIRQPNRNPEFAFASFMHDNGEKTVLGHKIPAGGGEQDGLQVIDILAHHPSTAHFICTKLARHFVADDPPPALVERLARTFTKTDGDLRAVLAALFSSREFFSEGAWQAKIRSPLEMVAGAVRALDSDAANTFILAQKVGEMGEPLYGKEAPTGYKDNAATWLSTASVMARMGFAEALVSDKLAGIKVDWSRFEGKDTAGVVREVLHRDLSPTLLAALEEGLNGQQFTPARIAGVLLSSPEFQRR